MDDTADLKAPHTWLELAEIKIGHARLIFDIGLFDEIARVVGCCCGSTPEHMAGIVKVVKGN